MIRLLFLFLYLAHLVQGTSATTTSSSCPPADGTTRSVWSILGSCGLTLLICVWHAIHPDVPRRPREWDEILCKRVGYILLSFFVPEWMVAGSAGDWWEARDSVIRFREKGYEWSMTHSHFARMDGFVYHDDKGYSRTIDSLKFVDLCEKGKIGNPVITVNEIKDRSKSDALGKTIFAIQLFWFMLQVVARGSNGLAVTLVELDTVCMAALTLLLLFFWWDKPLRPACPHIFYSPQEAKPHPRVDLSNVWKSKPCYLSTLFACFVRFWKTQSIAGRAEIPSVGTDEKPVDSKRGKLTAMIGKVGKDSEHVTFSSLCATWMILGGLHLIAWNFDFPTATEKMMWHVASLVLAGSPLVFIVMLGLNFTFGSAEWYESRILLAFAYCALGLGIVSRSLLVGLMLASLRALPCSAYQTVSWTAYIPHF